MTKIREQIANSLEHIHDNFEIDRLENLFRSWARDVIGKDDKRATSASSLNFDDSTNRVRNELRKEQRKRIEEKQ